MYFYYFYISSFCLLSPRWPYLGLHLNKERQSNHQKIAWPVRKYTTLTGFYMRAILALNGLISFFLIEIIIYPIDIFHELWTSLSQAVGHGHYSMLENDLPKQSSPYWTTFHSITAKMLLTYERLVLKQMQRHSFILLNHPTKEVSFHQVVDRETNKIKTEFFLLINKFLK